MDVREFIGRKAQLQVRDDHFNGWVELGRVLQTDKPRSEAQKTIPTWEPAVFEAKIDAEVLHLPVGGTAAPLQTVIIEIDGEKKIEADMPLAMGDTEDFLPAYDLTRDRGKTLRVRYHKTAGSRTDQLIRLTAAMPMRPASDSQPAFHIYCQFGALNDPNGLVYHDGQYHLFHQYAYGPRAKHWAHYVSSDLVQWEERPIGLFPDQFGSMHSGSATVDWFNTAGFQVGERKTVVAAFTGSRGMDPRAEDGHWVMVLFEDGNHSIFTSKDLKDWTKTGQVEGFHECPELFELALDGDPARRRWVMYGASGDYLVGRFDGRTFVPETPEKVPMKMKGGGRFYAAQTFDNMPGNPPRRVQVAWQGRQLSFPVELALRQTDEGPRLFLQPVAEIERLFRKTHTLDGLTAAPGGANPLADISAPLLYVEATFSTDSATSVTFDVRGKKIVYDAKTQTLKSLEGQTSLKDVGHQVDLKILVDNWSIDVFGQQGRVYMPSTDLTLKPRGIGVRADGVVEKWHKHSTTIPDPTEFLLTGREGWKEYKKRLNPDDAARVPPDYAARLAAHRDASRTWPLEIWAGSLYGIVRNWVGMEHLSLMLYDDRALVEEIVERVGQCILAALGKALAIAREQGVTFDYAGMWEDICFNRGPLVSPKMFREICGPWYRKITDLLAKYDCRIVQLDCDGKIDDLLPIWMENGVNCAFPIEVGDWADPVAMRRRYGKGLLMRGGFDKHILARGPDAIRAEVRRLTPLVEEGGFIPHCDHRVPADVPMANYIFYVEEAKRVWGKGMGNVRAMGKLKGSAE